MDKKIEKVLGKNISRLHEAEDQKMELVLKDENIPSETVIKQLIKENAELKIAFEETQKELSKNLRAGGTYVFETAGNRVIDVITNVKVLQDNQLRYNNKIVDIDEPEWVFRLKSWWKTKQIRIYFVEKEGEYTYDPRDKTPIEIKKRSESIIKIKNEMAKSSFVQNILKGLAGLKKWYEYIPWIVFGAVLVLLGFALVWWLNGYSLVKA